VVGLEGMGGVEGERDAGDVRRGGGWLNFSARSLAIRAAACAGPWSCFFPVMPGEPTMDAWSHNNAKKPAHAEIVSGVSGPLRCLGPENRNVRSDPMKGTMMGPHGGGLRHAGREKEKKQRAQNTTAQTPKTIIHPHGKKNEERLRKEEKGEAIRGKKTDKTHEKE